LNNGIGWILCIIKQSEQERGRIRRRRRRRRKG
jgi:hypothetical protein